MSRFSSVKAGPQWVIKKYTDPERAQHEISFYLTVPWACPDLIDHGDSWLKIQTLERPTGKPAAALRILLQRLAEHQTHHRDLHVGNVMWHPERGPVLIDWEVAIRWPGPSYDLYGPSSGVPLPPRHRKTGAYWWSSERPGNIKKHWT